MIQKVGFQKGVFPCEQVLLKREIEHLKSTIRQIELKVDAWSQIRSQISRFYGGECCFERQLAWNYLQNIDTGCYGSTIAKRGYEAQLAKIQMKTTCFDMLQRDTLLRDYKADENPSVR